MCCHDAFLPGGIECILSDSTGRGLWKLVPGFLQHLVHVPICFAALAQFLFTAINHNREDDSMLSDMSPYGHSLTGGDIGDPKPT